MAHPLDKADMESVIRTSPGQFHAGLQAAAGVPREAQRAKWGPIKRILLCGMGGSWMTGALVRDAGLAKVRIDIHRTYDLPPAVRAGTLVIASSFSGNTEETLSAYDAARAAGLPVVGIAAGGELEQRCAADGIPFVKIPSEPPTMQPRSATGYTVGILTQFLATLELATDGAVETVAGLGGALSAFMETARQRGEALVPALRDATPVIYAADRLATVAHLWKIKINENAKTPAFWNVFPELNHNEMIGWSQIPRSFSKGESKTPRPVPRSSKSGVGSLGGGGSQRALFHIIYLRAADDHPRIQKRFEITEALLRESGVSGSIVPIEGKTLLEQMVSTLLVGDWASYALALALGVDPSPVPMVEDLKKRLKE